MTIPMIVALAIVILMIVMIMTDKFSFGAPPLVACCLLVLTGVSTIKDAFAGFTDSNVVMIAGFLAVMAGLQKTRMMTKLQSVMASLATKGGFAAYALLIIVVMLGASVLAGTTGYYVMILSIASAIPYSKKLPNSKLILPLGFATGRSLIPVGVAFFMGLSNSLLQSAQYDYVITITKFGAMVAFMSVAYLIWSLAAYRILPDFDISKDNNNIAATKSEDAAPALPAWKEYCTYLAFILSIVGMIFASKLGEVAYIFPGIATAFLCVIGVFNFKEVRNSVFSPLIIMTACVIGVANALSSTGITTLIGDTVAKAMGNNMSPFLIILVFCLLTSACATLTGSSVGSVFIFAPIAIATCMSMGLNPTAVAAAVSVSAWGGGFLPIDGLPAMILGMGKYKLSQFLAFAVPMYLIQILGLAIGAAVMFPM